MFSFPRISGTILLRKFWPGKCGLGDMYDPMGVVENMVPPVYTRQCTGACGVCDRCHHKAAEMAAMYVIKQCGSRRRHGKNSGDQQRRYLKNQLTVLIAALGIADGDEVRSTVARSEWGRSMRERQLK